MSRRKALAQLDEELSTLAVFDRLHDLAALHDSAEMKAHELRQIRRSQIEVEINKVNASRAGFALNRVRMSSGFLLLCAVGDTSLRYLAQVTEFLRVPLK